VSNLFKLIKSKQLKSIQLTVEIYQHQQTGAKHIHFYKPTDSENCFAVFFRTLPENSKGTAHILEHTVLNGSQKYPCKSPFDAIIKRSLNSFINAMTASDWTAYPFASSNAVDFNNLLQVYLDAVFFPNLNPLDFAQEGHRLEFKQANDASTNLQYKGVVYNEMKGAMSSATNVIYHEIYKVMFAGSSYAFNSGGAIFDIVELAHSELCDFHKTFYHPSQAIFATYGNIKAHEHQIQLQQLALNRFNTKQSAPAMQLALPFTQPKSHTSRYPLDVQSNSDNQYKYIIAYRLPTLKTIDQVLSYKLLTDFLLFDSNAPLSKTLEHNPNFGCKSAFTGLILDQKQPLFLCGKDDYPKDFGKQILDEIILSLTDFCQNDIDEKTINHVLQSFELEQRSLQTNGYPFGINLIIETLSQAIQGLDSIALLDIDQSLKKLQQKVKQPQFLQNLCRELFLNNNNRCLFIFTPDTQWIQQQVAKEQQQLQQIQKSLTQTQIRQIITQSERLNKWQNRKDNSDTCLPTLTISDIDANLPKPIAAKNLGTTSQYSVGTNKVSYVNVTAELQDLTIAEYRLLPLYSHLFTKSGYGTLNYLQAAERNSALCAPLQCHFNLGFHRDSGNNFTTITVQTHCLDQNLEQSLAMLEQRIANTHFNDLDYLVQACNQYCLSRQNFLSNAHRFALLSANSGFSAELNLQDCIHGRGYLLALKHLQDQLDNKQYRTQLFASLKALQQKLAKLLWQTVLVSDKTINDLQYAPLQTLQGCQLPNLKHSTTDMPLHWNIASNVNYCSQATHLPHCNESHRAVLEVIATLLSDYYFHPLLREKGGAYGGGAFYNYHNQVLNYYSYRDPALMQTLDIMDNSIQWLRQQPFSKTQIEQSIIQIFAKLDRAKQPPEQAMHQYQLQFFQTNIDNIQTFRNQLIQLQPADVRNAIDDIFNPSHKLTIGRCVMTNKGANSNMIALDANNYQIL